MEFYILLSLSGLTLLISLLALVFSLRSKGQNDTKAELARLKSELSEELRALRQETAQNIQTSVRTMGDLLRDTQQNGAATQEARLSEMKKQNELMLRSVAGGFSAVDERLRGFSMQNEQKLDNIRRQMERQLAVLQEENNKKLEEIRGTVDEKLQQTLDARISQSFRLVSERLEQVYKGLGEMQTLAEGVGDLKKVMSGVKTRGILGEIQLGAILEQILPPEQYEQNVVTRPGSGCPVEFAVRLPGDGETPVYLPIDAKFPAETYGQLLDAYDTGDKQLMEQKGKELERVLKSEAKDIHEKYVEPPFTTDFAILFLPAEGLYAEVVRRGLIETLQRDYKINIAGPTTMAAILNSLQMGFKTLAIQKRSGEVWNILAAVKTEFESFSGVLRMTQQRLEQAHSELDKLVGVRTRKIQQKLRDVSALPEEDLQKIFPSQDDGAGK